jgi:HSP20 family protein
MLRKSYYRTASPWQELEKFRQLAHAQHTTARVRPVSPAINVWTNDDGAVVEAKLPGINPQEIDISIEAESVTIAGKRDSVELEENEKFLRRERRHGKFNRTFQLPFIVNADAVEATYENGVLHLTLPRSEADKPKKIAVKSA